MRIANFTFAILLCLGSQISSEDSSYFVDDDDFDELDALEAPKELTDYRKQLKQEAEIRQRKIQRRKLMQAEFIRNSQADMYDESQPNIGYRYERGHAESSRKRQDFQREATVWDERPDRWDNYAYCCSFTAFQKAIYRGTPNPSTNLDDLTGNSERVPNYGIFLRKTGSKNSFTGSTWGNPNMFRVESTDRNVTKKTNRGSYELFTNYCDGASDSGTLHHWIRRFPADDQGDCTTDVQFYHGYYANIAKIPYNESG